MEKLHGNIYIFKFCIICIINATDAWHQNIILTNLTSDIRQSHETSKGSHKLCFNCCSNLSGSLMLARLAVMPCRGCFPGCLLPHAEWCSIIALCPPPAAAAAQRRMGAVYTKTVALQSALPRSTLIVLLQCISQHEDCTQNQYSGHWWEHFQSIGTYSNVCRVVPNSRRQLVGILILTVSYRRPRRMLDLHTLHHGAWPELAWPGCCNDTSPASEAASLWAPGLCQASH